MTAVLELRVLGDVVASSHFCAGRFLSKGQMSQEKNKYGVRLWKTFGVVAPAVEAGLSRVARNKVEETLRRFG